MKPQLESITLDIDGMSIAGIRQRDRAAQDQPRLLCVHGWLDNANSFVPLMPYLPAFDLVAIDLPGHGYSEPSTSGYHFHELSFILYRIIDALQWRSCHLAGHSLGGCLTPYLAVAHPSSVQSLIQIEALGALSESAERLPQRMTRSFADRLNPARFQSRHFADKQSAIDSRLKATRMNLASARLIIDRQLQQEGEGFSWRFDPRWRFASPQYQTEEQVQAVLKAINCPVLTVMADDGFLSNRGNTTERLDCYRQHELATLSGHHHVHMDTPEPVAAAINRFLQTTPALGG